VPAAAPSPYYIRLRVAAITRLSTARELVGKRELGVEQMQKQIEKNCELRFCAYCWIA
jgi:hypothetical protein